MGGNLGLHMTRSCVLQPRHQAGDRGIWPGGQQLMRDLSGQPRLFLADLRAEAASPLQTWHSRQFSGCQALTPAVFLARHIHSQASFSRSLLPGPLHRGGLADFILTITYFSTPTPSPSSLSLSFLPEACGSFSLRFPQQIVGP